jgi:hypothetical protein
MNAKEARHKQKKFSTKILPTFVKIFDIFKFFLSFTENAARKL